MTGAAVSWGWVRLLFVLVGLNGLGTRVCYWVDTLGMRVTVTGNDMVISAMQHLIVMLRPTVRQMLRT